MFKSRNGFGLDSIIILISTIAIIAIMIGVGKVFMTTLENSYVSLTTSMPKFSTTGDYPDTIHNKTDSLLSVYNMLRSGIIWAIAAVLMIAGILFMLEQIQVVPASTAFGIISKGTLYFVILFGFPPIWDLYAGTIELGSKAIMDPANTGQTPDSVVKVFDTINGMGISQGKVPQVDNSVLNNLVQLFNGSDILSTFSDQGKALILGAIGSILSLILSFLTYMFAAIRQVLTAVLIAGLPIILILSLVPWFQGITKRLYDTLFGLSLVPIFSALVMVTGAAYLGGITTHPVEEQWFASVAVLTLSTFIPTILVPLLGSLFSSITSMASTATGFGGMMGMMAIQGGRGIGSGAYGAAMSAQQGAAEMGQSISGIGMVKAAMGGGLAGGFGGIAQGLSNVGSHALRRVGAKDLAYDMRGAGSQIMKTSQDVAHQYGNSVIQPVVDNALTENSAGVMTRLATIPVPEEQAGIHLQNGATLLNLARDSIETGNYTKILDHQYFKSVPVRDTQIFAKAVSATIVNHGFEPQKLANISYNLEKMGGLTSDNVKDFIQNFKVERSLHQNDKSQTLDENPVV
ncbi:MAG: hypothetical protein KGH87_03885 [Thaumarchaeota archaeon]|nr:hypothetical protein [Nitrososphaerota archaeon]